MVALAEGYASPPGNLRRCWRRSPTCGHPRGRHRLETVLTLAACAVLAGARSFVAVAEWAADSDPATRAEVGLAGPVPSESAFRRVFQRLDADRFDALLGGWAEQRTRP